MNDLFPNKKPPEANLKDCVLSLAEIVESLVGIQQQTSRDERIRQCADNEHVKRKKKVPAIKSRSEGQSVVRHGTQMFTASATGSSDNFSIHSYVSTSTFTQKCHPQMNRLDRTGQLSKEKLIAKNCVRLGAKSSGHTQKRASQSRVSSRPIEECLNGLTNDACKCSHSKQKRNPMRDQNCNKRIRRSANEDIEAESSEYRQYANEPCDEVSSSSNQKTVKNLGSGINSMQDACILWQMVERLRCIEEDLEDLALESRSNQGGTLTSKSKAHCGKSEKLSTGESKHSTMSLDGKNETIRNDCIDDLKEVFAELPVEVPDELWTDPRKARFFLDIILDLLEHEDIQNTSKRFSAPTEGKGGSSSKESNSRKELFIKELEKSLAIKTPQPRSAVKLLEIIYLQEGEQRIGRIKTQNIFRDDAGRISQNCGVVSGKVDPFRLLALNSVIIKQSRDNIASKAKNAQKGFKEESDADTGHSEGETSSLMDQNTPTRITKPNLKTERNHSAEPRWCYCQENNKKENAEDPSWSSIENIQNKEDSQNVSIKPDPDAQELPHIKTEGHLGQELISADTEGSLKIVSQGGQYSQINEISDSIDQVRMGINKSGHLTEATTLSGEIPTNRMESKIIPQELNNLEKLSGSSPLGSPDVAPLAQFHRQVITPPGRPNVPAIPRKIDFDAENSLISDSENKRDKYQSTPREHFPEQITTPTRRPNVPAIARKIDFDAENSPISDSESKLDKHQPPPPPAPESPDLVGFSNFGEGVPTSSARAKATPNKNEMNQEMLPQQTGSAFQSPPEKHTKGKFKFLTSCISSPDKEESTSIGPQEEFHSIRTLNTSNKSNFAPNETPYLNVQDSPDLTDQQHNHNITAYSTPHDITPNFMNQTTAENHVESLSESPGSPLASSTLKGPAEIQTPRVDIDTLETGNKSPYDLANIASPPLSPDRFNEPFAFAAGHPQLDSSPAGPTNLSVHQFSPIISTAPKFDKDESVTLATDSTKGQESKGNCPKLPEGYEALDDMIEVTLRGFEKMSNFLPKEPRITASPNLSDDPNELNKAFAAKITDMENTLSAVMNCIQCTLVDMSRVIERRAGITIPVAHLHDDPQLINLHCSKIFDTCKRNLDESNEGRNDQEKD